MKRIKMVGLDIAKSAFRLVYRPDTAQHGHETCRDAPAP